MDFRMRELWVMLGQEREERVAHDREIGQRGAGAGARTVLAPDGIAAPVIADFDATSVTADELLPLLRGAFLGGKTGQVVAGLSRGHAGFL